MTLFSNTFRRRRPVRGGARRAGSLGLCRDAGGARRGAGRPGRCPRAGHQPVDQSAARELPLPLDRTGEHGRPHRRHRGVGSDPNIIYVGYAVGGVFKSENNGDVVRAGVRDLRHRVDRRHRDPSARIRTSCTSAPARRTTGRRRRSATASTRRPTAARRSRNIGLKETQTIARIVIDPKNPETVYVASPGHLFGPNPERGVYKTTDGGKTWNKVKYIDENTGFTDIAIDPSNSNILYAASYQRRRSGCCFNGGGPGSALWKSDGRRQDVDEADRQRPAARHLRTHRARRLALESERRLRADRSGRRRHGPCRRRRCSRPPRPKRRRRVPRQ